MYSDILQATFPKLKLKIMDVTFLPGNLLHKAQSRTLRGPSSLGLYQTCQFLVSGAPNSSTGPSVGRHGLLQLAGIQRKEEGRQTEKGRRKEGSREGRRKDRDRDREKESGEASRESPSS